MANRYTKPCWVNGEKDLYVITEKILYLIMKERNLIFISYKRNDKDKVFKIKDYIETNIGVRCWIDIDGIESDAQFANVIIKAINEAYVFLFMYSSSHTEIEDYDKDWTVREISFAQKKNKRIVFINIDRSPLTDWFELIFGIKQQVDALSDDAMQKLCRDLKKWVENRGEEKDAEMKEDNLSIVKSNQKHGRHILSVLKKIMFKEPTKDFRKIENINMQKYKDGVTNMLTYNVLGVKFNMIKVEPGCFYMGTIIPPSEYTHVIVPDIPNSHFVHLTKGFYIGETPVTQELWRAVMNNNPSRFIFDTNPVDSVSWNDCQCFIENINKITGVSFRLPYESEWEFAARGGVLCKEYRYSGSDNIDEVAWFIDNSQKKTHPVKQKKANELGIYDMSGNVWEWCQDYYDEYEDKDTYDPVGPSFGIKHVYRGGCWCEKDDCRTTARKADVPDFSSKGGLGLRLVLVTT